VIFIISRKEAQSSGLKRYFTGKPCKHGHVCERYARGKECVKCAAENRLKWGAENPNKVSSGNKRWRQENEERCRANSKNWRLSNLEKKRLDNTKWREENREKARESIRRHYHRNVERMRAKRRAYRLANPGCEREYRAAYLQANLEKHAANQAKRRARKARSGGSYTADDVFAILKAQRRKCGYCRVKLGKKYHVDHIIALSRGGSNDRTNLQILCVTCNLRKSAKDPIDYAQSMGLLI
jgi:5-methylcytosine-specific restriction endonuclease McrA